MQHTTEVGGIRIDYSDTGSGKPIVFVHGVYVTGALWDEVISVLSPHYRCISPTWPFGAQSAPVGSADLGVPAAGRRLASFLDALDLKDVTLVANDTGGGVVLAALGDATVNLERVTRFVFTNCDSYEHFPPKAFRPLVKLCRMSAAAGTLALHGLASRPGLRYFTSSVTKHGIPADRYPALFGGFMTLASVRRDAARFTAGINPGYTLAASLAITTCQKPTLIVWGNQDVLFPLAHAERLAENFPSAELRVISDSATYIMIDDPGATASAIDAFARGR